MQKIVGFRSALAAMLAVIITASACGGSTTTPAAPSGSTTAGGNTTTSAAPATSAPPKTYTATKTTEDSVSPAYRQGVARVADGWVFSTNWALYRTTEDPMDATVRNEAAIPQEWKDKGYNHIGDIDVVGNVIYAPLEQPDYERDVQAMLRFDAATLTFLDGVEIATHENSFVTVDPATMTAYSMDRFGGGALTRYDINAGWKPLPPLAMSQPIDKVQGADLADNALWLSSDDDAKTLARVDQTTGQTQIVGTVGHPDFETEGIDATPLPSGQLHVLSVDAKHPVYLLHFKVTS